jgi:hypothetical protein
MANAYGNAHDAIMAMLMMLMMLMANAYGNAHDAYGKCLWQCS